MTTLAATSDTSGATLLDTLLPSRDRSSNRTRDLLAVVAGSVLLTISAKLAIPFWPVPVTLQTFVVLLLGLVLGPRLGAFAVIAYLAQGAFGLPVFAGSPEKGVGLAYLLGPTGGYLAGFVAAAFVTGLLARRRWDRHVLGTVGAMLAGTAVIYLFGLAWLGTVIGWDQPLLELGMVPFLLGDAAKVVIAAALLPTLWRLSGRR